MAVVAHIGAAPFKLAVEETKGNMTSIMKKVCGPGSLALLAVCLLPAAGSASTLFTFSNSPVTTGSITGTGPTNYSVSTTFNTISVNNAAGVTLDVTESYSDSTGILSYITTAAGTGTFNNIANGTTLLSITEAKNLISGLQVSTLSLYSGVTSATVNSLFQADLGGNAAFIAAANVSISSNSSGALTSTQATFTATPEPSSFGLLGVGLLSGMFFIVRRKSAAKSTPQTV